MEYTVDTTELKRRVVAAAIDLSIDNQGRFTVKQLCQKTDISQGDFYRLFNSKHLVLSEFYPLCVAQYRALTLEIDGYPAMSLSEKLGNFIYTMFDLLQEQREFVDDTFESMVTRARGQTTFHREVTAVFAEILESDPELPNLQRAFLLNSWIYDFLTSEFLQLLAFWISDDSPNVERSMALSDKLVAFLEEVMHSNVVGKGADLLKYILENNVIKLNIPLVRWFINR